MTKTKHRVPPGRPVDIFRDGVLVARVRGAGLSRGLKAYKAEHSLSGVVMGNILETDEGAIYTAQEVRY